KLPGKGQPCKDGTLCDGDLDCNEGKCTEPRHAGERCSDACDVGLVCVAGHCAPRGKVGAKCAVNDDCTPDLHCENETRCAVGAMTYARVGESCAGARTYCAGPAHCKDDTCVAEPREGEACDDSVTCE